jgi:hypothetical protein
MTADQLKKSLSEIVLDRQLLLLKRKQLQIIRARRDAELNAILKREQERCQQLIAQKQD